MKKLFTICLALLMTLCLTACGSTETATTEDEDKVYIIYSDNGFAPFEYLDTETNEYVGIDMELLAAIAEDQGFKYEMHNEGFDASCGAVQSGQADAMIAGMTIREDREEIYDFSDPYFTDGQVLTVAADSDIESIEDLAGKVVAVKNSTMGKEYAESIADEIGFTMVAFDGSSEQYAAVVNGQCAACFEDRSVAAEAIRQGTELKLVGEVINPAGYGFAVKKGSCPELIEMFNAGLKNIQENGTYDAILEKYGAK